MALASYRSSLMPFFAYRAFLRPFWPLFEF